MTAEVCLPKKQDAFRASIAEPVSTSTAASGVGFGLGLAIGLGLGLGVTLKRRVPRFSIGCGNLSVSRVLKFCAVITGVTLFFGAGYALQSTLGSNNESLFHIYFERSFGDHNYNLSLVTSEEALSAIAASFPVCPFMDAPLPIRYPRKKGWLPPFT